MYIVNCAEYRDIVPKASAGLSGTPGIWQPASAQVPYKSA